MTEFIKSFGDHAEHWVIRGKHVVLSRIDDTTTHAGFEVLAFPADDSGEITKSVELWGYRYPDAFPCFSEVAETIARFIQ